MVDWTEERVARLTLLHTDGSSASEIAKKLAQSSPREWLRAEINRLGLTKNTARARIVQNPSRSPQRRNPMHPWFRSPVFPSSFPNPRL